MSYKISFSFLVVVGIFIISINGKSQEEIKSEKCLKEYKLDKATIENFNKTMPIETKDKNIKCFFKCLLVDSKFMTEKGEFTLPKFENKEFADIAYSCKAVNGTDVCDKAFNFHNCIMQKKEANNAKAH